jgi:hypothetical protein
VSRDLIKHPSWAEAFLKYKFEFAKKFEYFYTDTAYTIIFAGLWIRIGSGLDPDSATLWIRIGNFSGKNALYGYFLKKFYH